MLVYNKASIFVKSVVLGKLYGGIYGTLCSCSAGEFITALVTKQKLEKMWQFPRGSQKMGACLPYLNILCEKYA